MGGQCNSSFVRTTVAGSILVLTIIIAVPPPNFITEIFFLTVAFDHYGLVRTIQEHAELRKELDHMQRQLDMFNADTTWQGVSAPNVVMFID